MPTVKKEDPSPKTFTRPKIKGREEESGVSPDWGSGCVDQYDIVLQIGEGTYGQVYKAMNKVAPRKILFSYPHTCLSRLV